MGVQLKYAHTGFHTDTHTNINKVGDLVLNRIIFNY